jgi:outer membrane protein assembly factor BamB
MATPLTARPTGASSVYRRARLPLFLGLLLALALSEAPPPPISFQKSLAAFGQRMTSLSSPPVKPTRHVTTVAPTTVAPTALPERDAPHEHLSNLYIKAPQTLYALDPATGVVRWTHATPEIPNLAPVLDVGVAIQESNSVTLLNGKTGAQLWRYAPTRGTIARLAAVYDDTVYAVETHTLSLDNPSAAPDILLALNDADGSVRWRYTVEHSHLGFVSLVSAPGDTTIYFNDDVADFRPTVGSITAINVVDGAILWRRVLDNAPGLTPLYDVGSSVIASTQSSVGMANNGAVYFGLDAETGALNWTLEATQHSIPRFTSDSVYVGGLQRLSAYNIADLSLRWVAIVDGGFPTPVALNGRYVAAKTRASFQVYNAVTGQRLWGLDHPAVFGVVRLVGDTLCASADADPGGLAGFDVSSGKLRWTYDATDSLRPALLLDNVFIYVRTFAAIMSFNPATGAIRWQAPFDARFDLQMDVTPI